MYVCMCAYAWITRVYRVRVSYVFSEREEDEGGGRRWKREKEERNLEEENVGGDEETWR